MATGREEESTNVIEEEGEKEGKTNISKGLLTTKVNFQCELYIICRGQVSTVLASYHLATWHIGRLESIDHINGKDIVHYTLTNGRVKEDTLGLIVGESVAEFILE